MQVPRMKTVQYRDSRYRDRRLMSIKIIKSSRYQGYVFLGIFVKTHRKALAS